MGYFCSHSCSNNWLVGWVIPTRGTMWSSGAILLRLVEASLGRFLLRDLEGPLPITSGRAGLVEHDCRGSGLDPPRRSVCGTDIHTVLTYLSSRQKDSILCQDVVTPGPITPAHPPRILFLAPRSKTLGDINVVTRSATADHHRKEDGEDMTTKLPWLISLHGAHHHLDPCMTFLSMKEPRTWTNGGKLLVGGADFILCKQQNPIQAGKWEPRHGAVPMCSQMLRRHTPKTRTHASAFTYFAR